jgi:hypothetical protein
VFHCALAAASAPVSVPLVFRAELEATMFAMLIGVGALFLAVFVSAILDPRWSRTGGAGEHARLDAGSDYVVDAMLRQRIARRWKWGSLIAPRTTPRRASVRGTSPFAWQLAM